MSDENQLEITPPSVPATRQLLSQARAELGRVVSGQDEVHASEEDGKKGKHPKGLVLMPAVADPIKTGCSPAKIYDRQKKGGQGVDTEIRAQPGQAQRQHERRWRRRH